jgi:hypothetical protein
MAGSCCGDRQMSPKCSSGPSSLKIDPLFTPNRTTSCLRPCDHSLFYTAILRYRDKRQGRGPRETKGWCAPAPGKRSRSHLGGERACGSQQTGLASSCCWMRSCPGCPGKAQLLCVATQSTSPFLNHGSSSDITLRTEMCMNAAVLPVQGQLVGCWHVNIDTACAWGSAPVHESG